MPRRRGAGERRALPAVLLATAALVAAGCEDAAQADARKAVQARLAGTSAYDTGDIHCTHGGRVYLQAVETTRFICSARLRGRGDCDWFRVDLRRSGAPRVALLRRHAGCVLPA